MHLAGLPHFRYDLHLEVALDAYGSVRADRESGEGKWGQRFAGLQLLRF